MDEVDEANEVDEVDEEGSTKGMVGPEELGDVNWTFLGRHLQQFACTATDWASTLPPKLSPEELAQRLEAARRLSPTRGGFAAPGGLAYHASTSALPQFRPWNEPNYQ